ncbi:unnamed protein product, partial [Pylaiella littoralis]
QTARKDIALRVLRKKYQRLEADMFRSRIELADTLGRAEKERQKHDEEARCAEERSKELETALRGVKRVLRQLTAETKRNRHDAEERESFLLARLANAEGRAEASESECRREKLSTWRTIARETERAAGRERYQMTAFLQRYVVENEFLRLSTAKAKESASDLRESLRQVEEKLVRAPAKPPARVSGVGSSLVRARKATWAGPVRGGSKGPGADTQGQEVEGGGGQGSADPRPSLKGEKSRGGGGGAAGPSGTTQAELAIRRMENRAGACNGCFGWSANGSDSDHGSWRGCGRRRGGGGGGGGGCRAQRAAVASARGELRFTRGLVAELSSLLSATERERDSLASLLVLTERKMEQFVIAQEELALKMAWGNMTATVEQRQLRLTQQHKHHDQHRHQYREAERDRGGDLVTRATDSGVTEQQQQQQQQQQQLSEGSSGISSEESRSSGVLSSAVEGGVERARETSAVATATPTSTAFGPSRTSLEGLELRRRVRELETLLEATEAGAREIEKENRMLKNDRGGSPTPWMSWEGWGGVVGSTAAGAASPGRLYERRSDSREDRNSDGASRNDPRGRERDEGVASSRSCTQKQEQQSPSYRLADGSLPSPMLSAADIGGGGGGGGGGEVRSARAGTAGPLSADGESFSEDEQPRGWGWEESSNAFVRPEGRCRPRLSPFAQQPQRKQDCAWWRKHRRDHHHQPHQLRGHRQRRGCPCKEHDGGSGGDDDSSLGSENDGSLLIKRQLAWVLGLPPETTTGNELLAEVMHLVVQRGSTNTDAAVLEAQLKKMDDQALTLTRLAAATASTNSQGGGNGGDRHRDSLCRSLASAGRGGSHGWGDGQDSGGLSPIDVGASSLSNNPTFFSSVFRDGGGGTATGAVTEGRRTVKLTEGTRTSRFTATLATGHLHTNRAYASSRPSDQRYSTTQGKAGMAGVTRPKISISGPVDRAPATEAVRPQQKITTTARSSQNIGAGKQASFSMAAGSVAAAAAISKSSPYQSVSEIPTTKPLNENTVRTSFPKLLQGRVVSIDVFCTKIVSDVEQKKKKGEEGEPLQRFQSSDVDYEIRAEAYDPAVLKQHVLHITDEHIKQCLSAHPHLYTLGSHRTRVHQSLADRLVFMSAEDVLAQSRQHEPRGSGDGGSGGGGMGQPSSVTTVASNGSGRGSGGGSGGGGGRGGGGEGEGGGRASLGGTRGELSQLLVLIGEAGEVVTAEKRRGEGNADGGDARSPEKRAVHKRSKNAMVQIEKEEEIMEGVVYEYGPSLRAEIDEEQAKIAMSLLAVDTESSSE